MAGPNEKAMVETARGVNGAAHKHAIEFMALYHRGTVVRFGSAPGMAADTKRTRNTSRVGVNKAPGFVPPKGKVPHLMTTREVRSTLRKNSKLGDRFIWENTSVVAAVLDQGRRFNTKLGRITGSEKNPDGWREQAIQSALQGVRNLTHDLGSRRAR